MTLKITKKIKELLLTILTFGAIFYLLLYSKTTSEVYFMNRWLLMASIGISIFLSMSMILSPYDTPGVNLHDEIISFYYKNNDLYTFKKNYLDIVVKFILFGLSIVILVCAEKMEPENAYSSITFPVWVDYLFFIFWTIAALVGLTILTISVRKSRNNKITINRSSITWSIDGPEEKTVEMNEILEYHLESNVIHLKTSKGIYEINLITLSLDLFANEIIGVLKIYAKNANSHF